VDTRKIVRTLLDSDPGQAHGQLEELAGRLPLPERASGEQLRAVAVELIRRGLEVTVVDYQDPSQELEIILPQARNLEPVTIDRDPSGTICHLAWEYPADITDEAGVARAADTVAALLHAIAAAGKR
jgi:NAD(P)-dependent dehydrogenase (short-subunit alcohol dehydrogenase family)